MGRIEKTVFISYRRRDVSWALAIFENLTKHGYDVFIDYEGIASGSFETAILQNIRARAHFLVLLTPSALERCADPRDWMRREIEAALDSRRNIVPLMLAGFNFGTASELTGRLAALQQYNGLQVPDGYFPAAIEKLRDVFLSVLTDAVLHPASDPAQLIAKEQKDKATAAMEGEARKPAPGPLVRDFRGVQLPAEISSAPSESTDRRADNLARKWGRIVVIISLLMLIGGVILYFSTHSRDVETQRAPRENSAAAPTPLTIPTQDDIKSRILIWDNIDALLGDIPTQVDAVYALLDGWPEKVKTDRKSFVQELDLIRRKLCILPQRLSELTYNEYHDIFSETNASGPPVRLCKFMVNFGNLLMDLSNPPPSDFESKLSPSVSVLKEALGDEKDWLSFIQKLSAHRHSQLLQTKPNK